MEIRRIRPDEWRALRDVRLRALAADAHAFGSSLERERARPDEWWRTWAEGDAAGEADATFLAWDGEAPAGIAAGFFRDDEPRRVTVVAMWVVPEARRTGLGRALLEAVEAWAFAAGAEATNLSVTDVNPDARAFSLACGYVETGHRRPLARDPTVTEISMRKLRGA